MCLRRRFRSLRIGWAVLGVAALAAATAGAEDWPQWRGAHRNGISAETGWLSQWPPSGPNRVWTARVGEGYSSATVVGGRLFTMGNAGNQDTVYCLNARTGAPIWRYSYPCISGDSIGTRATPTVSGNGVYTLSSDGRALCLSAAKGTVVWQRNLAKEMRAQQPQWGFAGSPLVEGNLVLYNVGSFGGALDKNTGRPAWYSGPKVAGYASPVAYTVGNQRGVALFVGWGIVALNPQNGRPYWQYPWQTSFDVNAADPIFAGDKVFLSSNYNRGCALLRVGRGSPSVVWQNRNMRNHFNSCVLLGDALYGNDEDTLKCIDLKTGAERWGSRGMGKGGLIAADGKIIVLTERGELVLAAATPDRYREITRAQVMRGTCWTHPVLANGFIYCRSHEGELICLDVRGKTAASRGTVPRR
jgi:outer membrane protein assembly factor BamB